MSDQQQQVLLNIQEWLRLDTDPVSKKLISALQHSVLAGDTDAVERARNLFAEQISFGTAGLRGPLGPGFSCMNSIIVRLTTQV